MNSLVHVYQPLNPVLFEIGPFTVYKYAFMILLGVLAALYLGLKEGKKLGMNTEHIFDGLLIILPLAILGARLWYVIFEGVSSFRDFFTFAGLAIHGGVFVALIAAFIYTKYRKIDIFKAFDLMAPGFLIGQAFGRWGNFFNQEAHGGVIGGVGTNNQALLSLDEQRSFLSETLRLPDFITNQMFGSSYMANNAYYHPTFLYESLWNIVGIIIILILRRTKLIRSGDLLGFYLIWYSVGRFFIEGLRTDSLYVWGTALRTAQLVSILMIIAGVVYLLFNHLVWKRKHYYQILMENDVQ